MVGSRLSFFCTVLNRVVSYGLDSMETPLSSTAAFDLTGEFGGFIFTVIGKRRMVLRTDGQDYLVKVPRLLRRRIIGTFRAGQALRVVGTEETDGWGTVSKRVAEQIVPAGIEVTPAPARTRTVCTVKVCAKKNCWRSGGQEIFKALKQEAAVCGFAGQVEIKAVGCLDRCQQAPNLDTPWREYRRCAPRDAKAILAEIAARFS